MLDKSVDLINFLAQIDWTFAYGIFQGTTEDSPLANSIIGSKHSGVLNIKSAELSGLQESTIGWYRDEEYIKFRVLSITRPKE